MKKVIATNLVLIGILIGLVLAWACGSAPNAHAQVQCTTWKVNYFDRTPCQEVTLPDGWEPFAAYAAGAGALARTCVAP